MERTIAGPPKRDRTGLSRRVPLLWAAGIVLIVYAAIIAVTGGIDVTVAGIRIRSRSWQRPAVLAVASLTVAGIADRKRAAAVVIRAAAATVRALDAAWLALSPRAVAIVAVAWTLIAGVGFSTSTAGGADSSGYLNQARLLARAQLLDDYRMRVRPSWPELPFTLAPLGFRPTPERERLAPTYPPGYPMLLAPALLLHERAAFWVVPLCGMLAVWLTYALGWRLGAPGAGATAALLVSVSPTFLYQLVQPMSDVPAVAAWLLALYLAMRPGLPGAVLAGLAAGVAILIRPNLAPLAAVVWAATAIDAASPVRRMAATVLATAPAVFTLAIVQAIRFGSPWSSGYGRFRDLFSWSNIGPNLDRYPRWMFESHTPAIALFLLAPLWTIRLRAESRILFLLLWAFAVLVVLAYLPYFYFQTWEWTYTRFLLPAIPLMWLLALIPASGLLERRRPCVQLLVAAPLIAGLLAFSIAVSRSRYVFELGEGEQKYTRAAEYVRGALPGNSIFISMQHSGSLWFYTRRPILRWDHVEPRMLDESIAWCKANGYAPFMVIDGDELERMKKRFVPAGQQSLERAAPLAKFGDTTIYGFN